MDDPDADTTGREDLKAQQRRQQKLAKIQKVLTYIANHIWRFGYQPSLREIAVAMGHSTPVYIQVLLKDHFRRNKGGRSKLQTRAIEFDWRHYVTEASVPWDNSNKARQYPAPRAAAKRKVAARKLADISQ